MDNTLEQFRNEVAKRLNADAETVDAHWTVQRDVISFGWNGGCAYLDGCMFKALFNRRNPIDDGILAIALQLGGHRPDERPNPELNSDGKRVAESIASMLRRSQVDRFRFGR